MNSLNVAVFGLGYVGSVTAACLARNGHHVIGVDANPLKTALIRDGCSPVAEPGLPEVVRAEVEKGRLRVTESHEAAVRASDLSLICVGTPSDMDGGLDLEHVRQVLQQIGSTLRHKDAYHVVVLRSTLLPGSVECDLLPVLVRESGKQPGRDVGLCVNPEFLREGSGIWDFDHPPYTLIGELDQRSGDRLATLYAELDAPLIRTDLRTAAMIKYASNTWHALKITFANEIGTFCKRQGIDSHRVMEIFGLDNKLNISTAYLTPGFAFGGSCLPKDLRALLHHARAQHLELPVLEAIPRSNAIKARRGIEMILHTGKQRVGVLGISFKENTDDLRESPMVQVIETLIGKGRDVRVYDADLSLRRVMGANRRYIEQTIPHIASLMCDDAQGVLDHAEVLVVGKRTAQFRELLAGLNGHRPIVDLVRIFDDPARYQGACTGISW